MEKTVNPSDRWNRRLASGLLYWPACLAGTALIAIAVLGPEADRRIAIERQCQGMQAEVDALTETRDQLKATAQALESDPEYTERVVRHELGIARPGELLLPQPVKPTAARRTPKPAAEPALPEAVVKLADLSRPELRLAALVAGATLLGIGIVFSLPSRPSA